MAKTKISEYSSTANSNTDIASINIDEGCAPSGINNAIRALMAQLKDFQTGAAGDSVTVGGVLTVTGGSASAPAITTSGDTNTGVLFPAADTVGITTGGTERVRVDSSGNVGVGVTPSAWATLTGFQVKNAALAGYLNNTYLLSNTYYDTNYKYIASAAASMFVQASGQHQWFTAPSGTAGNTITFTQAMTLDASGRLLVGTTTSPSSSNMRAVFQSPNASGNGGIQLAYNDAGGGGGAIFSNAAGLNFFTYTGVVGSETYTQRASIDSSGRFLITAEGVNTTFTSPGQLAIKRSGGSPYMSFHGDSGSRIGFIQMQSGGDASVWTENAQPLTFGTNGSERARIDSSGRWLVNATSAVLSASKAQISYSPSADYGLVLYPTNTTYNNASVLFLNNAGSTVGYVYSNASTTTYATSSDYRLKENIAPMTGALATVAQLKPCTYTWKADGSAGQGFIAHELQAVVPEAVVGEKDAVDEDGNPKYQGIDTSFLVATLTAAIQEQQAIIQTLTSRIEALEQA